MRIEDAILTGVETLKKSCERPKFESETLLGSILGRDRLYLLLNQREELSSDSERLYREFLDRRKNGVPIEYITKRVGFYSEEFFIDYGALIPRPETEILVDRVLEILKSIETPKVLEIGVGSGIISTTLAIKKGGLISLAVDISPDALQVAKVNIEKFGVEDRVELRESDLFQNLREDEKFDLIVSNPPYISDSEKGTLQKELDFEPDNALYGGVDGDEVLKAIIDEFFRRDENYLVCEMGYNQKEPIEKFVNGRGELNFYRDLAEHFRGFSLEKQK